MLVLVPLMATVPAIRLLWQRADGWGDIALLVGLYLPASMGITIGFRHYLRSHVTGKRSDDYESLSAVRPSLRDCAG